MNVLSKLYLEVLVTTKSLPNMSAPLSETHLPVPPSFDELFSYFDYLEDSLTPRNVSTANIFPPIAGKQSCLAENSECLLCNHDGVSLKTERRRNIWRSLGNNEQCHIIETAEAE